MHQRRKLYKSGWDRLHRGNKHPPMSWSSYDEFISCLCYVFRRGQQEGCGQGGWSYSVAQASSGSLNTNLPDSRGKGIMHQPCKILPGIDMYHFLSNSLTKSHSHGYALHQRVSRRREPGISMNSTSLLGYSPWGRKEWGTTE